MPEKTIPLEAAQFMATLLEANMRSTQSVTNRVEDNLQQDAIRARDMVVSMLDKLWELSDQIDSHKLHNLVGDFSSMAQSRGYFAPFYFETEEHKKRMTDIDNGIF